MENWFAVLSGIIFLGAGSLMAALGERVMKIGGATLMVVGAAGLIFWFGYYRNADAQVGGNCNNYGPGGTITGSCNTTISPPHRADSMYQGDEKIGKVQQPLVDESHGVAVFGIIVFEDFPDPNKPFEYENLLLTCDKFPRRQPNVFVGKLLDMEMQVQCQIVGKR